MFNTITRHKKYSRLARKVKEINQTPVDSKKPHGELFDDNGNMIISRAFKLKAEIEEGNCEYKLKLINLKDDQLTHRITQLNWRLNEGKRVAFYFLGYQDDGSPIGIPEEELVESIQTLHSMTGKVQTHPHFITRI